MKAIIWIRSAVCALVLIVFGLSGCEEELEIYSIDAPADLQARIDSIAAAKAAIDTGDTTFLDISTALVGAEDNSAAWWTAFSDYFSIPTNKLLHLEFINNGAGVNNWNNWNLAVANLPDRDADGYSEYFVLRSDAFGWGNEDFDLSLISHNYSSNPEEAPSDEDWANFRSTLQGARVTLEIDHSSTGNVFVTATAVGTNGTELVMTYQQPVSATEDIVAFLVADGSHFKMEQAYLLPSRITSVEDVGPVSIQIDGAPDFIEIGDNNFWGNAVATVTYADGSSTQVDSTDLSFNVSPDLATTGEKTVTVAYSKTKQGAYGPAVSTFYTLEVTNAVSSLEVTMDPDVSTYYFYGTDSVLFHTQGVEVTATYSDGSTGVLANENLNFSKIPAVEGSQMVNVSYEGAVSTVTTTIPVTMVQGADQVGANDYSTGWWTDFSAEYNVASGASQTIKMYCYSNEINNWHSPSTILRRSDLSEYAVLRMDNYGWSGAQNTAGNLAELGWTLTNDWNFDMIAANLTGAYIEITVTNNGDDTADVHYDVTYANGETHFQDYAGITVDSSDLNFALVLEGAYIVIVE